jgi:hypothetical protein
MANKLYFDPETTQLYICTEDGTHVPVTTYTTFHPNSLRLFEDGDNIYLQILDAEGNWHNVPSATADDESRSLSIRGKQGIQGK